MAEAIEDEAPLPALEDFFLEAVDDLEVSFGELSVDGKCFVDGDSSMVNIRLRRVVDTVLKPLDHQTSTPRGKHDLTPSSKQAPLPKSKRFEVGK